MAECKICNSNHVKVIYHGLIRDGGLGKYTKMPVIMQQCEDCGVIWHEQVIEDAKEYYESKEYRNSLEGSSEAEVFYRLHDKESSDKFLYTGTEVFRNKVVADIGCGCVAYLDFLKGVADTVIAIEPSETYRQIMEQKNFITFPYAEKAKKDWGESIDIITSFDVIEHVEEPYVFLKDIFDLLKADGGGIIGTPTDAPVMRSLLGELYEQELLFSTQHLWIFAEKSLEIMARRAGFKQIRIQYFQRYGLSNLIGWLNERRPCGNPAYPFVSETMDAVWKAELGRQGLSDYIVMYLKKEEGLC